MRHQATLALVVLLALMGLASYEKVVLDEPDKKEGEYHCACPFSVLSKNGI